MDSIKHKTTSGNQNCFKYPSFWGRERVSVGRVSSWRRLLESTCVAGDIVLNPMALPISQNREEVFLEYYMELTCSLFFIPLGTVVQGRFQQFQLEGARPGQPPPPLLSPGAIWEFDKLGHYIHNSHVMPVTEPV